MKVNIEHEKISEWFQANKLSLNEDKTRFTLFSSFQDRENLPLQLPALKINNHKRKRSISIKLLGVLVDERLSWKDHINITENKLSKTLGLLHNAKTIVKCKSNEKSLFFIHS